jgi:predicted RNase H-like nuclease (RuvC/YqgF family)
MRYSAVIIVVMAVAVVGCSTCGGQEEVIKQVDAEKENLVIEKSKTDSLYQQTLRQVDEMMSVLSALEAEEGIVKTMGPERGESAPDFRKRMEDIARRMNDKTAMIRKQAEEINVLKNRLASTEKKLALVTQKADSLGRIVSEQQQEIVALRQQLASSRRSIDSLKSKLAEKDQIINSKVRELNSAYYIVGKSDDLFSKGIIDKQGQVLFFGGRISVKQNFDVKDFTKIDIASLKEIKIPAPKDRVSLVSNHEATSFEIVPGEGENSVLKIGDEKMFWKNAKYLVIMTE